MPQRPVAEVPEAIAAIAAPYIDRTVAGKVAALFGWFAEGRRGWRLCVDIREKRPDYAHGMKSIEVQNLPVVFKTCREAEAIVGALNLQTAARFRPELYA